MKQEIINLSGLKLDVYVNGMSKSYVDSMKVAGKQFNKFMISNNYQEITPEIIKEFLKGVFKKYAPETYNLKRGQLLNLLKRQPKIQNSYGLKQVVNEVFKDIKRVDIDRKKKKNVDYITKDQVDQLIDSVKNEKHKLIIEFLFKTGCRVSEMLNIRLQDVKLNTVATITVVGKGSKSRSVWVSKVLYERLRAVFQSDPYLLGHSKKQFAREYITRMIKRASNKLDLDIHSHTLRHSFAMYLVNKGKSPNYVASALGHSNPKITVEFYYHDSPDPDITELFE